MRAIPLLASHDNVRGEFGVRCTALSANEAEHTKYHSVKL